MVNKNDYCKCDSINKFLGKTNPFSNILRAASFS